MPDHTNSEHTPPALEEHVNKAIRELEKLKAYLSVADTICEIEIESISHGTAVQDAIKGMMRFSYDSIDNRIEGLEDVLKAGRALVKRDRRFREEVSFREDKELICLMLACRDRGVDLHKFCRERLRTDHKEATA